MIIDFPSLPLDIKFAIASKNIETWTFIALCDPMFYNYTRDNTQQFVDIFIETVEYHNSHVSTELFGKLHSNRDHPSAVLTDGEKQWHVNDELHRTNDLPARITHCGTQIWYRHGKTHRENDRPAVIHWMGVQEWWINGKRIKRIKFIT